jgi:hypothetical protein
MHDTCPAKLSILSVTISVFAAFRFSDYVLYPSKQQVEMLGSQFEEKFPSYGM